MDDVRLEQELISVFDRTAADGTITLPVPVRLSWPGSDASGRATLCTAEGGRPLVASRHARTICGVRR